EEGAVLGGQLRRGGQESRRRGVDAALALHGLDQDQRGVRTDGGLQRRRVVQAREADAGDERLEGRALRRLARRGQGAQRPSVEGALERDHARPAGRLARVLDRSLDRLGARVAEERPRAAEPVGEEVGEPRHRLRPVEVRDVPEPVELRVRGGERLRVAVAEADDGDAGGEVEVAGPVRRGQPGAVALDEGDVGAGVRRQDGVPRRQHQAVTSVRPISARTPVRAATTAACSLGTMPPSNDPASTSSAPIRSSTRSSSSTPGTSIRNRIRPAPSPIASAAAASSALTLSGPAATGATTGIRPAASASTIACGRLGTGEPTWPSSGTGIASSPISSPARPTARGPISAQSWRLTARSASRTTSIAAGLVTRRPWTKVTSSPAAAIAAEICGPPPWTTTASRSAPSSSPTTAPPTLTTVMPRLTSCTPR